MRSTYHYGSSTSGLCVRRTVDAPGQNNGDTGGTFDLGFALVRGEIWLGFLLYRSWGGEI